MFETQSRTTTLMNNASASRTSFSHLFPTQLLQASRSHPRIDVQDQLPPSIFLEETFSSTSSLPFPTFLTTSNRKISSRRKSCRYLNSAAQPSFLSSLPSQDLILSRTGHLSHSTHCTNQMTTTGCDERRKIYSTENEDEGEID